MLGFEDESGISEKPVVRRTWALKGKTPVIEASGGWKSLTMAGVMLLWPVSKKTRAFFRLQKGAMNSSDFITLLNALKRVLRGRKLLLIWDGLPSHRSKQVVAYLKAQRSWLRIERYPAYAPELSPLEFLWSSCKTKDLAHIPPQGAAYLKRVVARSFARIKADKSLLRSCFRAAGVLR